MALRQKISDGCEQLIMDFFNEQGQVVIYDANNGTKERRQRIADKFIKHGIHVILLGSHTEEWVPPWRTDLPQSRYVMTRN